MDQLTDIIIQRIKLINHYRIVPPETLLLNREMYVDQLIKQKRKETNREVLQTRLLQALSCRRIDAPYRKEEYLRQSQQIMKAYDPSFQFQTSEGADVLTSIVNLYVAFFNKQQCERRGEELLHIFKKGLCEKGMVIPTIMNWFINWLRKTFKSFIKSLLQQLREGEKQKKSVKNSNLREDDQKNSIQVILQQGLSNRNNDQISGRSKLLQPRKRYSESMGPQANNSLLSHNMSRNLKDTIEALQTYKTDLLSKQSIPSTARQIPKSSSISVLKKRQTESKEVHSGQIYNKDIFFSAFYEELIDYYRFFSTLSGLDPTYVRSFRRIDRRQEFKGKFGEIAKSFVRTQAAKRTYDEYLESYQKFEKKKLDKISLQKQKKNVSHNNKAKINVINANSFQKQERLLNRKTSKLPQQKYRDRVLKTNIYSKTIQIDLPEIQKSARGEKSPLMNLKRERYQQQTRQLHKRHRGSIGIYREMSQINQIFFQRKSTQRLQVSKRQNDRYSSLSYLEKEDEIVQGRQKQFKFPRIGR